MNNYIITNKTMAILSNGKGESIVYEESRFFIIKQRPNSIIKKNCQNYGISLDSAIERTKILTGINYKPPIILSDYQKIIIFPTKSLRLPDNEWICLNQIKDFHINKRNNTTMIEFKNGKVLEFKISYNSMNNQILRAYFLQSKNEPLGVDIA